MGFLTACRPKSRSGPLPFFSRLFDQGSADAIARVDATHVRITPEITWTDSKWKWWAVRWNNLAGKNPIFLIAKAGAFNAEADDILAVWASDGDADSDTWTPFATVTIGATDIEFQNGEAFPSGMIYIAAAPMYPIRRTQRKMSEWLASALVSDTPSSTDGVLGYATPRSAGDGSSRTAPALPFYAFKISSGAGAKNKIVLTSGNHPDEAIGRFALEGAVDWLLAGSDLANFLLDYNDFYVYPCLNPQGVWSGYYRSCPEDPTKDMNRQWVGGGLENVDVFLDAFAADLGGAVEVALDFHAWFDNVLALGIVEDDTVPLYAAYEAELAALETGYNHQNGNVVGMLHKMLADTYGARIAMSAEHGFKNTRGIAEWKAYGQHHMQAMTWFMAKGQLTQNPGVGSRGFNGSTDRIDWANIANLKASPITISAWINLDDYTPTNQYVVCLHNGSNAYGIVMNILSAGNLNIVRDFSPTDLTAASVNGAVGTGAWQHILITHDGSANYNTTGFYVKGVSINHHATTHSNGTSTEAEVSGYWSIGGRRNDDTRNTDGKIAQVGVWNRVLSLAEIANLAGGYAPSFITSGLQFYFAGNTASLSASPGGNGTADGTTQLTGVGNGPAIIYP